MWGSSTKIDYGGRRDYTYISPDWTHSTYIQHAECLILTT